MSGRLRLSAYLISAIVFALFANGAKTSKQIHHSSAVRNSHSKNDATFENTTAQSLYATPVKQTPKVEESEGSSKRAVTEGTFVWYIQRAGCSAQLESRDRERTDYRFTSGCSGPQFIKAVKDATGGPNIDVYEKTRNTIDPRKLDIPEGSGLTFYERSYSFGVMTRVTIKERIRLNDVLAIDKDEDFAFVFEQDKTNSANDFFQFGARASKGDFNGFRGLLECNFFIQRGHESDYDFDFSLNGRTMYERNFYQRLGYNKSMNTNQGHRRSLSDNDDDDAANANTEVSRFSENFYISDKFKGYISNEGVWSLFIPKTGINFNNANFQRDLANRADALSLICSNNAFEGKSDVSCASAMIINEANVKFNMYTEVPSWLIKRLGIYRTNANVLLMWSDVGLPSFRIPPSLNYEPYFNMDYYNERERIELMYYIDRGTTMRVVAEGDALDNLSIDRRKYTKVFFDINCRRLFVTITAKPALNVTCTTLKQMIPAGVLNYQICNLVGENLFSFEYLKITKYGALEMSLGPADGMILVDENSKVKNLKLKFKQTYPNSQLVDIEGQGQEKICGVKVNLGMRRLGETNQGYMTGRMALFEAGDLQERCAFAFASNRIKNQHGCLRKFPIMKLQYSFIMSTKDSYFEFETLIGGLPLKGQIVQCNNRNQASLAIEQTNGALTDLMKVLYKDKEIDMGALPLYASSCVLCVHSNGRFYEKYSGNEEKEIKCLAVANYYKNIKRMPIYDNDVMLHLSSLDFTNCPNGTLGASCRMMKKALGPHLESSECFGKLERNGFRVSCEIDEPFKLIDGMTVEGDSGSPLTLEAGVHWREVQGKTEYTITGEIQGYFCARDTRRQDGIPVFLKFKKDGVYLCIPRPFRAVQATFLNMDNLVETVVRAWEYPLPETLEYIQTTSDLEIHGIKIEARPGMTQQYVYSSRNRNKYFIFDQISKVYLIDSVYRTFRIDPEGSVLAGCQIKECGFASYQGRGYWKIEEFDLRIKKGTWMVGKATCQRRNPNLPVKNSGPIDVKVKLDNGRVKEFLEMDPILVDKRVIRGKKKTTVSYAFSMTRTNKTYNVGPYMVMEYSGSRMVSGSIEGYIRCVGFEGYARLKIDKLKPFKVSLDTTKSKQQSGISEDAQYVAGFQLEGELIGPTTFENSKLRFKINAAALRKAAKNYFETFMRNIKKELLDGLEIVEKLFEKDVEKISPFQVKKAAARKRVDILKDNLINFRQEQRESEDFMRSKCSKDCNLVHTPGFKWTENCAISKRFVNASCISFSKDAHVAGDVNCVAKCEIQKADTRQLMQSKAKDAKVQIREHKDNSDLETVLQQLEDLTGTDIKEMEGIVNRKTAITNTVNKLSSVLNIVSISTDGWRDMRKVEKPFSTTFKIWTKIGKKKYWIRRTLVVDGKLDEKIGGQYIESRNSKTINKYKTLIFDAIIKDEVINNNFDVWRIRNREEIDFLETNKRVVIPEHKLDREEPMEMDPQLSSLYTPKELHNEAMVKNFAPWHVLKDNDPLKTMANGKKFSKRDEVVYKNDCHATRSKINEFSDMVAYMKTWTRAYNAGKMIEPLVKRNIDEGLKNMSLDTSKAHKRSAEKPTKRDILASKWTNTLQTGFTEWGKEFSRQLASVNTMGPKIIKEELSAMFVTSPKETLESYIETSSAHADVAFKKSFVSKNKPFAEIAKNFINHLKSDKTLEELVPLLNEWDGMIRSVDKRTISCHDEL